jgi:hypothetical protein
MSKPCGAAAIPDRDFNRDMEAYGLPQRRYCCLAGHTLMVGLPASLSKPTPPSSAGAPLRRRSPRRPAARQQSSAA